MRTQLLGLAAAALTAGTLALPTSPAQAIGGLDSGTISATGTLPTAVAVAGTTSGDAMAAWVRPAPGGFRIQASQGTDGAFALPVNVTPAAVTSATDLQLVANNEGDVAALWIQTIDGDEVVRGARYVGGGQWDGATTLSTVGVTDVDGFDAGIDGAGNVLVLSAIEDGPSDEVHLAVWPHGQDAAAVSPFANQATDATLAVNEAGRAVLAWSSAGVVNKVRVTTRGANGAFTPIDEVPFPNNTMNLEAGIADDGRATVAFLGIDNGAFRLAASDIDLDGEAGFAHMISPAGLQAEPYSFEVARDGRATASWVSTVDGAEALRMASRAPGGSFGGYSTVQTGLSAKVPSLAFARTNGAQVVVHASGSQLTLRHRSNPAFTFATYAAGPADGPFAADADSQGNVVAVSVVDNGGSSYVQGDWLDTTAPTAAVTAPGAQVVAKAFDVTWSATDSLAGVKTTDVISSSAAWNSATFSDPKVVGDNLATGPFHQSAGFGRTYCYEVQSIDKANNLGQRSARKCTAVPLDDTALLGSGWSRAAKSGQFNGTWTTTSTKGRTLTRAGIKAKRLALVANRVPNGGLVEVRWNGTLLKKVSLKGSAATKKVYPIVTWAGLHTGTLTIKVISASGRPVRIDGLVVAK